MEDKFFVPNKFADPIHFLDPIPVGDPYPLPPIWDPPGDGGGGPVKDPFDPKNPIYDDPPIKNPLAAYQYYGVVRDAYTEQPLPGATVRIYDDGAIMAQSVADRNGSFNISLNMPVDAISITEVSHKPFTWPASEVQHFFDLEPDVKMIDPVILPPGSKKTNYLVWIIAGLVIAKSQKWI